MALTNPEKVVTEQRLNEYHQTILPYLGGMPDVLANKFNKSDLYSTDEKIIGQWIDGKPLYQKVVIGTPDFTAATGVDTFVYAFIKRRPESGSIYWVTSEGYSNAHIILIGLSNGTITIKRLSTDYNVGEATIILQYTKTSDSPVAIGSDTDYSTTEKIVGTWIDGKPIYQKTWLNLDKSITANQWNTSVLSIADIGDLLLCQILSDANIYNFPQVALDGTALSIYGLSITRTVDTITLQYTKTTD